MDDDHHHDLHGVDHDLQLHGADHHLDLDDHLHRVEQHDHHNYDGGLHRAGELARGPPHGVPGRGAPRRQALAVLLLAHAPGQQRGGPRRGPAEPRRRHLRLRRLQRLQHRADGAGARHQVQAVQERLGGHGDWRHRGQPESVRERVAGGEGRWPLGVLRLDPQGGPRRYPDSLASADAPAQAQRRDCLLPELRPPHVWSAGGLLPQSDADLLRAGGLHLPRVVAQSLGRGPLHGEVHAAPECDQGGGTRNGQRWPLWRREL
mmetsp:Transcript_80330/g.206715  ORF Transcript_80330/g.206715 Transcript_80330/m.206715 type:complete len:262 (-) Transcript_80330:413-1198(-)